MIVGEVNAEGVPILRLRLAGAEWLAIVDTGFNGDLELPLGLRTFVDTRFICRIRSSLAGGQMIEEDSYLVDFPFDGQTVRAEATFVSGREVLIGTHLLREHRLEIDFTQRTMLLARVD